MPPRVSVIVTCFDLGSTLEEALASVEAQSFRDLEILVVDDGSTDPQTLVALERIDSARARVLRTGNRGLPAARNHGAHHSQAEYLCCLDADDRLHAEWLAKAVDALDRDADLAFVSHWLQAFGDEEWDWKPTDCGFPALLDVNTVNGAALVRRAVWESVGGQDETLREGCEDWDFWITLVERGFRGAILPEILFYYRRRADSMSRAMVGEQHLRLYGQLIERHPETFARHLPELWARRQQALGRCRRDLDALDHEWDGWLAARLDDRRSEAAALPARPLDAQLGEARAALEGANAALDQAGCRIAGLEQSQAASAALAEERARGIAGLERSLAAEPPRRLALRPEDAGWPALAGDAVLLLDAGDVLEAGFLARASAALADDASLGMVTSGVRRQWPSGRDEILPPPLLARESLLADPWAAPRAALCRRAALLAIGAVEPGLHPFERVDL